ncbi:subtilisin-like serine protease [Belliella baltica DSM 15883]|uniref:Subtilisin-like serine protease n=1 Tax=Belliella baltica (strain DSM 15883 / CIP 108006 / LMG 21964 / BA134) TaxID=866536 RepID=I3Z7I0_BELBD|nr:S8 family serine peptidase [Belliella baltica]AFL85198.1 subtilisin-like serine protease [Belliella baltica DSM 15883]
MGRFKFFAVFGFVFFVGFASAQNKYAVHYKYKPQENFSLESPTEFLTEKSIQRRASQGIALDSLDLPVSEKYISIIKENVQNVIYNSNWMNASLVEATEEQLATIGNLDFVEKVVLVYVSQSAGGRFLRKIKKSNLNSINFKFGFRKSQVEDYEFQNSLLGIPEMHEEGFKGEGVTIAVFDAGFPGVDQVEGFSHLIARNQIIGTKDFVDLSNPNVYSKNQHGTNVLSLIAANSPELLVSGAPDANYILCITEDVFSEFRIEEYNWVRAAEYADSLGVDIINSSLGYLDFDDPNMDYTFEDLDGTTAIISQGADIAGKKGILIVTSAGNYGPRPFSITAPADANGILAIGGVDRESKWWSRSSQGPTSDERIKPELSTLGTGVTLITQTGSLNNNGSGTSFSAPQIAALAAGLWQAKPELTKDELIELLKQSGSQSEDPDNLLGYGIPNFSRAYFGEVLNVENPQSENFSWRIYPNPNDGRILYADFGQELLGKIRVYQSNGNLIFEQDLTRPSNNIAFEVDISQLKSGLYIVEMQSGREIRRTKLIKR